MRQLILFLLIPFVCVFGADKGEGDLKMTVTISAHNWGPDSLARDNYIISYIDKMIKENNMHGWCTWLNSYTYEYSDSSISVKDFDQVRARPMLRFYTLDKNNVLQEDKVTTHWIYIKVDPPEVRGLKETKSKYGLDYDGWDKGPVDPKVKKLNKMLTEETVTKLINAKEKVHEMVNDNKDWTHKTNGKKLTKEEKSSAAWRIALDKEKATNYTKTKIKLKKVGRKDE